MSGVNEWLLRETLWYDTFHWNCCIPEIPEIEKLRFLGVSRCKFKLRFWLNLNLYRVIWAAQFRGSRRNFSGNCPIMTLHAILCMTLVWDSIQFPQIQIEILVEFEFVPSNLSGSIWWFSGCSIFSGTCPIMTLYAVLRMTLVWDSMTVSSEIAMGWLWSVGSIKL